jgi:RNA polymerase sigma-70 factor, ECF subfamily
MDAHRRSGPGASAEWDWAAARSLCLRETQRILGRGAAAEDAAQDATLRAWRQRGQCLNPDRPQPWLAAIARREALRHAVRPAHVPLEEVHGLRARDEPDLLRAAAVRDTLRELGSDDRRLLAVRYWGDLPYADIARCLGLAEGTVKVRLHRLRARLRDQLSGL